MRRIVIGGRNRVLTTEATHFVSGGALIADFAAYAADFSAADVIIWAWYAQDEDGRPDVDATLRGTEAILGHLAQFSLPTIFLSTDAVFAGDRGCYGEADTPAPQTDYARIKLAQESLLADSVRIRFTTFGPSYNPDRPLLLEMVARSAVTVQRPRQRFSPISTVTLNRSIEAILAAGAGPGLYHLTSEPIAKIECVERLAMALGVSQASARSVDDTPLDLSLTSATHVAPLAQEIDLAVEEWRRLRA